MNCIGTYDGTIFYNPANKFCIVSVKTADQSVPAEARSNRRYKDHLIRFTAVGYEIPRTDAVELELDGEWAKGKYGVQLQVEQWREIVPRTKNGVEGYLASGLIKGIGPKTAADIVERFGVDTLDILEHQPERLLEIRGITENKLEDIKASYAENRMLQGIMTLLAPFKITPKTALKIYQYFGPTSVEILEKSPFELCQISGFGFRRVDAIVQKSGGDLHDPMRIKGAVFCALDEGKSKRGHLYISSEELEKSALKLLNEKIPVPELRLHQQEVRDMMQEMILNGAIVSVKDNIYLPRVFAQEDETARRIAQRLVTQMPVEHIAPVLEQVKVEMGLRLSAQQEAAVYAAFRHGLSVITGSPGTGKTTIIKSIIKLYEARKMKVVLCAPTGRAAKRMQEQTGKEATTIHRLLEIRKLDDENFISLDYPITPIDADVVIIDEMSMVDMFLMNHILKAIYLGTKLVLVGDIDQLPSVGPGNVLQDIIESNAITTIELNKIFRQAAKSKIITNAHRVNSGETFIGVEEKDKLEDFFYINEMSQEKMLQDVISLCTGRLKKYGDYDFFKNIQVLTPTKKGMLGTKELNKQLQNALNPKSTIEKQNGDRVFRIGDRVMQVKNNYDIYWEKKTNSTLEAGSGIFNGELGIITEIDEVNKQIEVCFDDEKVAWYDFTNLDELEHSYSITIHKSQRK